jgi:hypothetical protein
MVHRIPEERFNSSVSCSLFQSYSVISETGSLVFDYLPDYQTWRDIVSVESPEYMDRALTQLIESRLEIHQYNVASQLASIRGDLWKNRKFFTENIRLFIGKVHFPSERYLPTHVSTMLVSRYMTVGSVRKRFNDVNQGNFALLYKWQRMKDHITLADYGVESDTLLEVVLPYWGDSKSRVSKDRE